MPRRLPPITFDPDELTPPREAEEQEAVRAALWGEDTVPVREQDAPSSVDDDSEDSGEESLTEAQRAMMENVPPGCPDCPICLLMLVEPLRLSCNHAFCRLCLLQTTRLAPDGRACPLCRAPINIPDPLKALACPHLTKAVRELVDPAVLACRSQVHQRALRTLARRWKEELPVFAMYGGTRVGARVALHFFEPRYKILMRRCWEGNRRFIFCGQAPRPGAHGVVVHVAEAQFLPDGRANVVGRGERSVILGETWVDESAGASLSV